MLIVLWLFLRFRKEKSSGSRPLMARQSLLTVSLMNSRTIRRPLLQCADPKTNAIAIAAIEPTTTQTQMDAISDFPAEWGRIRVEEGLFALNSGHDFHSVPLPPKVRVCPIRPALPREMFRGYLDLHRQDQVTRKAGPAGGLRYARGLQ